MKGNQHQLDGGGEATPTAKGQDVAICEECRQMPSKYKCPGCSIRTCSLPCVNSHKHRTGCPGKRDRSKFLPLSCFNDSVLLSDYNMLEEVKRVAESSQRTRAKLCPYSPYRLPLFLRGLRSAAASRKTKLLFLSNGMSKRVRNQTRYDHRKRVISWTIEWQFPSVDVVLYDHGIPEDANLRSVIKSHLQPGPWNHHLRRFCDVQLDQLKFFIRKHHKGPNSPFRELDIDAPIRQQLADLVILEYPVIHIFLPTDSYDFEILKDIHPIPQNRDAQDTCMNDSLHMNGACFPEEEIEDGHVEFHTVDLMKHQNGQEVELDFDQGLIDAYSDLIALINPDEFLDLDCVYAGKEVSSVGNEVEEGEILE